MSVSGPLHPAASEAARPGNPDRPPKPLGQEPYHVNRSNRPNRTNRPNCLNRPKLEGHSNWVKSVAISPDGQTIR